MRIIQLFLDDKFVDAAIDALSHQENVLNIIVTDSKELKYVKSKEIIQYTTQELVSVFPRLTNSYDYVFFHSLPSLFRKLIIHNKKEVTYCWFLWGFDYYNEWEIERIRLCENLYSEKKIDKFKDQLIYNNVSHYLFGNNFLKKYYDNEFLNAVRELDFVAPVLPNEFKKIKRLNSNIKYLPYTYGYLEKYIGDSINVDLSKKRNILLGNSADPSNNHISILFRLSKINLEDRKVIVPLSYSGNEKYKNEVIEYGYKVLGDKFVPLSNFIPIEDYNNIVFNCGIVIFNHIRQQAIGNLIVMGYLGAKIFLNKKSVTSKFLNNYDVFFKTTDHISYKELNTILTCTQIESNKEFFYSYFSKEAVEVRLHTMLSILRNKNCH
ncbi:TDP-N-acetylfucosamine:lipid II N-acetylfucosaminyltransferase [Empedobacter falsenii]